MITGQFGHCHFWRSHFFAEPPHPLREAHNLRRLGTFQEPQGRGGTAQWPSAARAEARSEKVPNTPSTEASNAHPKVTSSTFGDLHQAQASISEACRVRCWRGIFTYIDPVSTTLILSFRSTMQLLGDLVLQCKIRSELRVSSKRH